MPHRKISDGPMGSPPLPQSGDPKAKVPCADNVCTFSMYHIHTLQMKISKLVSFAAVLFGAWFTTHAAQPTYDWYSQGQFRTGGYYPMHFDVYAHDDDGDLSQVRVDAHLEVSDSWNTYYGSGDGTNNYCEGWGESTDFYSDAHVFLTDSTDTYYSEIELVF
jgi:hypothetical protein